MAREHGLKGVIAKCVDSIYLPARRSPNPLRSNTEGVIVGWVLDGTGGARGGVGSLLLGAYDDTCAHRAGRERVTGGTTVKVFLTSMSVKVNLTSVDHRLGA